MTSAARSRKSGRLMISSFVTACRIGSGRVTLALRAGVAVSAEAIAHRDAAAASPFERRHAPLPRGLHEENANAATSRRHGHRLIIDLDDGAWYHARRHR